MSDLNDLVIRSPCPSRRVEPGVPCITVKDGTDYVCNTRQRAGRPLIYLSCPGRRPLHTDEKRGVMSKFKYVRLEIKVSGTTTYNVAVPSDWSMDKIIDEAEAAGFEVETGPPSVRLAASKPDGCDYSLTEDGIEDAPRITPPKDSWFDYEGRRWATNGNVLVRSDASPMPKASDWFIAERRPENIDNVVMAFAKKNVTINRDVTSDEPVSTIFGATRARRVSISMYYTDLMKAADKADQPVSTSLGPVRIWRGGHVIAYIMPRRF